MNTARDESPEQLPDHGFPNMPTQTSKLSQVPPPAAARGQILLVDDGSPNLDKLGYLLHAEGYQVTLAATAQAALEALESGPFDLLIAPMARRPEAGLAVLQKAKRLRPRMGTMILAGHPLALPVEAYSLKVDDYLLLPCSAAEFSRRVAACLERGPRGKESTSRAAAVNDRALNTLRMLFHDLRSSLVSMDASLNLMSRGKFGKMDEGVAHKLSEVSSRVGHLIGMTEDFLGKTFLAESDFHLETEDLDLRRDIINQVLKELYGEIADQRVVIHHRCKPRGEPIPVRGNRFWLKSVFRNLLHNAIKYGVKGGTIEIGLEDQESCWRLNVSNRGRPLPSEDRARLFSKFARGGSHKEDRVGGLGLGLYLIQDIIKKHGGDIWYEPREHGSNFVFTLPRC